MRTVEEINALARYGPTEGMVASREDAFSRTMQFLLDRKATQGFIEIGVRDGGSFKLWAHYFSGIKIGIDTSSSFEGINSFSNSHGIRGDSHALTTIKKVKTLLAGELVDWLFIDGDHRPTPHGPEPDYHNYKRFVRSGGFIGFHDVDHVGHQNIKRFWDKLPGQKIELECGLGILTKV